MRPLPNSLRRRGGAPVALLGNAELRRAMVGPAHPCGHRRGRPRARLRNGGRREEEQSAAALHSLLCRRQLPWSPSSTGTTRRPRTRTAASAGRRRAGVLGAERAAASSAQSRSRTPLKREKEGDIERREREGGNADRWAHCHVASTSAKPHSKPPGWPNVTGFESWMVKATRFWSWMAKIKLGQELDGQKWTLSKKKDANEPTYIN